jgi:hypothetical protein
MWKRQQRYLKHSQIMTSGDAARPGRQSCALLLMEITLRGTGCKYSKFINNYSSETSLII